MCSPRDPSWGPGGPLGQRARDAALPLFALKPSQPLSVHLRTTRLRMPHEAQGCRCSPAHTGTLLGGVCHPCHTQGRTCHAALTGGSLQRLSWGRRQQLRVGMAQQEGGVSKHRIRESGRNSLLFPAALQHHSPTNTSWTRKKITTPKADIVIKSSSLLHLQHHPTEISPSFQKTSRGCFATFNVSAFFFSPPNFNLTTSLQ